VWLFLLLPITIVSVDRLLKLTVFHNIEVGYSIPIIKNILHITPIYNTGIAFGMFKQGSNTILIAVSSFAICLILYVIFAKRPRSRLFLMGLLCIMSGAVGNLVDRILYGRVLDFIDIRVWPIFNVADSAITIGAGLLILHVFLQRPRKAK